MGLAKRFICRVAGLHAQFLQINIPFARVEEREPGLIQSQRDILADDDALFRTRLQRRQLRALFVEHINTHVRTDGQLDAGDARIVRGNRQPSHDVQAHALRCLHKTGALAVRAVEID